MSSYNTDYEGERDDIEGNLGRGKSRRAPVQSPPTPRLLYNILVNFER